MKKDVNDPFREELEKNEREWMDKISVKKPADRAAHPSKLSDDEEPRKIFRSDAIRNGPAGSDAENNGNGNRY